MDFCGGEEQSKEISMSHKLVHKRRLKLDRLTPDFAVTRNLHVVCVVQELYEAGEDKWGTDEEVFNRIFSVSDFYTLNRVWTEYVKVRNNYSPTIKLSVSCHHVSLVIGFDTQCNNLDVTGRHVKFRF